MEMVEGTGKVALEVKVAQRVGWEVREAVAVGTVAALGAEGAAELEGVPVVAPGSEGAAGVPTVAALQERDTQTAIFGQCQLDCIPSTQLMLSWSLLTHNSHSARCEFGCHGYTIGTEY